MKNEFLNALGTDKANINTDLSLYAKFVGDWTDDDALYGDYGTTIRVPIMDNPKKWNIVYVSKWSVDRLVAEEINNDIIQTGINKDANDKTIWQWNFRNITENTFSWKSIYSKDNGNSWKFVTKVEAKRVG